MLGYTYRHLIFFDLFAQILGFLYVDTRSHMSFSMSINLVIPDQISQLEKPTSFFLLAWLLFLPEVFDFFTMASWYKFLIWEKNFEILCLYGLFFDSLVRRFFEKFSFCKKVNLITYTNSYETGQGDNT